VQHLGDHVRAVEQTAEEIDKRVKEGGEEGGGIIRWPPVILALPGMLVSGHVVSSRAYNRQQRDNIEEAQRESPEVPETAGSFAGSLAGPLTRFFREPTPEEVEALQGDDYEPQTIYLLDVTIIVGGTVTELSGIAVEFDQVIGWTLGQLTSAQHLPA
jgi:hypothetical protein